MSESIHPKKYHGGINPGTPGPRPDAPPAGRSVSVNELRNELSVVKKEKAALAIKCDEYRKTVELMERAYSIDLLTPNSKDNIIKNLLSQISQLEAANTCDACAGTGEPISGLPCMCGGSGKMSDAVYYLRGELFKYEHPEKFEQHFSKKIKG